MSVLIVEDDPALGERLAVEVETRGDAALPKIESGRYRAIVLDLMLPGMTGFDIVRHVADVRPELLRRIIVVTIAARSGFGTRSAMHRWFVKVYGVGPAAFRDRKR